MMTAGEDYDRIEEQIRSLLSPFTDSASELRVSQESATTILVEGTRRFRKFSYAFQVSPGGHLALSASRGHGATLEALISGPQFANLDALARSMIPFLKVRLGEATQVVDSPVTCEDHDGNEVSLPASQAIVESLVPKEARTRLTFLHGQAGAGKSWLLMKAALTQTHAFLTRRAKRLDLYVDAQGVNLRSLEQQIARQLDVYNGVLRFPEVVPLARLGVLGLIVDGFDELITPSGSNDTLRALYRYLADFDGQGAVLASARTSFFQLHDLESARVTPEALVSVGTLEVKPWTATEWQEYCAVRGKQQLSQVLVSLASASPANSTLLGRPFVVAEMVKLLGERGGQPPAGGLLAVIEEGFAERERRQKLVDPDRRDPQTGEPSPILSANQFYGLLLEVADEMWRLRQNSLDIETLKTIAGMWADEWRLDREYRSILVDRIGTNAFLDPAPDGGTERRVQFPHEVIFARTLARLFARAMFRDPGELLDLLRLAPISRTIAEQFADIATSPPLGKQSSAGWSPPEFLRRGSMASQTIRWRADDDANARIGLGGMVCELLRVAGSEIPALEVCHLHFSKVAFAGAGLGTSTFRRVTFEDVDARNADWSRVSFQECDAIGAMRVVEGQRFPESLPPVHHLVIEEKDGNLRDVYGTSQCRRELFGGMVEAAPSRRLSPRAQEIARVTEALARRAQRSFWFGEDIEDSDDRLMTRLKTGASWAETIALLRDHGLIESSVRPRSGVRARLFHLKGATALLEARDPSDRPAGTPAAAYWDAVERLQ